MSEMPYKDSSAQPSPASAPIWKPTSERKIQANRQNALRSTGPKTERGKRNVARNAIKHGILAREVVITAGDGEESLEDFNDLVKQLDEQYEPVGILELLVQEIAACWWKKARVLRAENGETRKRLDTIAQDRALRNSEKASRDLALWEMGLEEYSGDVLGRDRCSALQVAQTDLWRSSSGLSYLSRLLQRAKSDIASDGKMSGAVLKKIYNAFLFWDYAFVILCLSGETTEDQPPEKAVARSTDEKRAAIVISIDNLLERISTLQAHATDRENLVLDAEARSFSLPPADATDKLLPGEPQPRSSGSHRVAAII
jgi:hypothetical protein